MLACSTSPKKKVTINFVENWIPLTVTPQLHHSNTVCTACLHVQITIKYRYVVAAAATAAATTVLFVQRICALLFQIFLLDIHKNLHKVNILCGKWVSRVRPFVLCVLWTACNVVVLSCVFFVAVVIVRLRIRTAPLVNLSMWCKPTIKWTNTHIIHTYC